jgi:hypothetical protein
MIYCCELCFYQTDRGGNLKKHFETKKHKTRELFEKSDVSDVCQFVKIIKNDTKTNDKVDTKINEDDNEKKPKKKIKKAKQQRISATLRMLVWDYWIGDDISKTKCLCCKSVEIRQFSFECGHIIAASQGGQLTATNLKPVCKTCNSSMHTENMDDFMNKWNLTISEPRNKHMFEKNKNEYKIIDDTEDILTESESEENKNDEDNLKYYCKVCKIACSSRQNIWKHKHTKGCIRKHTELKLMSEIKILKSEIKTMSKNKNNMVSQNCNIVKPSTNPIETEKKPKKKQINKKTI